MSCPDEDSTAGVALVMTAPPGLVTSSSSEASVRFQPATTVIASSPQIRNGVLAPDWLAGRSTSGSWMIPFSKMLPKASEKNFSSVSPPPACRYRPPCDRREFAQHVAVEVGFGAEPDRVDGEPGEIDVGRGKSLVLHSVRHQQDRSGIRAGGIELILGRIQAAADRRSAARRQATDLAGNERRRADQRRSSGRP